jgi:pilus assembly protein Flp/PilA
MLDLIAVRNLFSKIANRVRPSEIGASMVEYALLLALIAVICVGAVSFLGSSAQQKFTTVGNCVSSAGTSGSTCPTTP